MAYHRPSDDKLRDTADPFIDIFAEFDFSCANDCCDFFCPECSRMSECITYNEIKDGWKSFYM